MGEEKHLREVEHPYYWTGSHNEEHPSWDAFLVEWGDADEDYNLVTRWDWLRGEDDGLKPGQEAIRIGFVHQRKGTTSSVIAIMSSPSDIVAARSWLQTKWEHMKRLWAPLSEIS